MTISKTNIRPMWAVADFGVLVLLIFVEDYRDASRPESLMQVIKARRGGDAFVCPNQHWLRNGVLTRLHWIHSRSLM